VIRPSVHDPITKSYAIDQIEDLEHLRAVAHRMWEAFFAAHSQAGHAFGTFVLGECEQCVSPDGEPCEQWKAWQRKVDAGFGSV
jgi:hypothetical protein